MGNEDGDGMDGGVFGNKNWGGGRFSFEFFFQNLSCETGVLKTDDDNWEKGQINYFVGHQIGSCENFPLDSTGNYRDLYLIFENSSCKNQVRQTGFLASKNQFRNLFFRLHRQ